MFNGGLKLFNTTGTEGNKMNSKSVFRYDDSEYSAFKSRFYRRCILVALCVSGFTWLLNY